MRQNIGWIKKWALAIAIAMVLNLFVNYGIATFYKAPKYEDYCNSSYPKPISIVEPPAKTASCPEFIVPENLSECVGSRGFIQYSYNASGCVHEAYCETCGAAFEQLRDRYDSNVFFILVLLGVLAVITGLVVNVQSVGTGFLIGGIISILIGTVRNWSNLTDVLRFLILGVLLAILVLIGYRYVKD